MKESFYEELEPVLDQFPKYHMEILLGESKIRERRYFQTNKQ
jgi:hypothetical protein